MKPLYTTRGEQLKGQYSTPYPRPQLKRDSFFSLDGPWQLTAAGKTYDILVPFCPESLLSGVGKHFGNRPLCYQRTFTLPKGFVKSRVLLHFGAVDQTCVLLINGHEVGEHTGGYHAFSFDITEHLQQENHITLLVTDTLNNPTLP